MGTEPTTVKSTINEKTSHKLPSQGHCNAQIQNLYLWTVEKKSYSTTRTQQYSHNKEGTMSPHTPVHVNKFVYIC